MSDEEVPAWRYLVPGPKKRTMTITRAGDPAIYWGIVAVSGTLGVLVLRKVWKRLIS